MIRLFLSKHAQLLCTLICLLSEFPLFDGSYHFKFAIDGLVDADSQRANAGDVKKINKRDD